MKSRAVDQANLNYGFAEDSKLFWSPTAFWRFQPDGKLRIKQFIFPETYASLFPEFYFLVNAGISVGQLELALKNRMSGSVFMAFVNYLYDNAVLIDSMEAVQVIFKNQGYVYQGNHPQDPGFLAEPDELRQYTREKALRYKAIESSSYYNLERESELSPWLEKRKSVRAFDTDRVIQFSQLSQLLHVISGRNQSIYRYYPSAGGLFPIDVYIVVKEGRIESIEGGIYLYNPFYHQLQRINGENPDFINAHYGVNKSIFATSAFSVYLFYCAGVSAPKYGGMGYYYSIIESGIIVQLLTCQGQRIGISNCIIGNMEFDAVQSGFQLSKDQLFLFCAEFGLERQSE